MFNHNIHLKINIMKAYFFNLVSKICTSNLFLGIFFIAVLWPAMVNAQVNFTQTLNADFNQGVLNNVVVSSDNVYLQYAATDVGSWLTTTVLPQTLSGHKTATWVDKYAYVVGGYNNLTYSNAVYVGTIQSGGVATWNALNPLPVALKDPAVVIGTNTIYVMGGRDASQIYNTIYYAAINTDGSIGAWQTSLVTLPTALWGHTALYLNGYIYVAGGSSSATETSAISNVYYAKVNFNNTLSSFTSATSLPLARNKHSMVTYNSKLYVLGGYDNSGTKSSTVYIAAPGLDGSLGAWSAGTSLPVAISNHSSAVTNGLITVMAGAVGATLSNTVYYANADAVSLSWVTSPNLMYDFTKDGSAFQANGQVYYTGGANLSGTPIYNCRYANLSLSANYVNHGVFVSNPFYQLGAERLINSLSFTASYNAVNANLQVSYRTALSDGIWSNWTALSNVSPIVVSQTKQYLQYQVVLTGSTTFNSTLNDATITTPGTQLTGNLNATTTFTKALSPYWATSDISFTAGTHTFQAGATILFLPQTGLTVSQANVICNGTVVDSVKFLYYTNETGQWDGIYFDPSSDVGVSSQFYYTVIANAGYGTNNANLYCNQSSEPLLVNCSLRNADGNGIRLYSANVVMQNSSLRGNTENGAYLDLSNPSFVNCALSYNGGAGVFLTSTVSVPTYSSTTIDHNLFAYHYPSPNFTFYQPNGTPAFTANTYNGIAIDGGTVSANHDWNSLSYDYILLGTVIVQAYPTTPPSNRLTIEPGNTIKVVSGAQIQIGTPYAGELYALGTYDSLITFTSYNGLPGGWNGIYFTDASDSYSGQSQMDYCIIEKGNDYNYLSVNTTQPNVLNHSKIRNAVLDGAQYQSAYGAITNCQFTGNGRYPLHYMDTHADPVHTGNTYSGNGINYIALSGGTYDLDRTITNEGGMPYYVLDDIFVAKYSSYSRLTVNPGVIMAFAVGKKLQVGIASSYGGDLYAQGTVGSPIVFKAYNATPGGWGGIYFTDVNDSWGGTSVLTYCTIKQGATYNLYMESSTQPSLDHCTISLSAGDGIVEYQSNSPITNCTFLNNAGYPLRYNDWTCDSYLRGNTYTGNSPNYIALSGGDYNTNRRLYYDGVPYRVLADIRLAQYGSHARLTLTPGVTLAFEPGVKLQVGVASSYGGDLWAIGKADSIITFKPYNNAVGGWNGIYFPDQNDTWGGTSFLTYCTIDKGATYNINAESSTQPSLNHCIISNSGGDGIDELACSFPITNCTFLNNAGYPLKYNDWTCSSYLFGNTYTGNTPNYIALSGGTYTSNITYYNDGVPYRVLSDMLIAQYGSHSRITIRPGITMAFEPGVKIQLGNTGSYGGDIYAEGTADSIITFKPYNNTAGGWNGLVFTDWNDNWGGTSSLKYCNISKALTTNISCSTSGQPTIDHCIVTESTGIGLSLSGNSNLTIKNSTFTYNTSYGIMFDGTSTATLGNTAALTCNIYDNNGGSGYQLYNNSTANVNARYNFWGAGDSTMVALKIYDKLDNSVKGRVYFGPFAQVPSMSTPTTVMSGTVKYANSGANPMKNAAMAIKDFGGIGVASTTTNTSGVYAFSPFTSGNYQMTITPTAVWGGVNSTDALNILNHFAQVTPLTGMGLAAADVNASHSINGTDALLVMERYSAMISSFPAGDYLYTSDTLYTSGNVVTNNIRMACFGDVNLSYGPAKKSSESVGLVHEGSLVVGSFTEFEFPVKLKTAMHLGAISLGFYYPGQYLEITGARLANGVTGFSYTAIDGLFRMGWCDMNALNVNNDDVVVILKMKAKDLSGLTAGIALDIYEDCEFADGLAVPNDLEVVSIPTINTVLTGINPGNGHTGLSVYPNPATEKSVIDFSLENPGVVRITLLNIVGSPVMEIATGDFSAGNHKIALKASNLKPGVYLLKIESKSNGETISDMIKLVVSN